jgi:hypothetical protein
VPRWAETLRSTPAERCWGPPAPLHAELLDRLQADLARGRTFIIARAHILDRHRHGAGQNASEFPQGWSDDEIIRAVEAVADDLASTTELTDSVGRLKVTGNRNSVEIVVIVEVAGGRIVTGYPKL